MSIVRWTVSLAILAWCAVPAAAQSSIQTAFNYNLAEEEAAAKPAEEASEKPACGCAEPSCEAEASCGCESGCCNSGCGGSGWGNCLGDCCLGEPWLLKDWATPNCCNGPNYGGWVSMGYYNNFERLSSADGDSLAFNDFPEHLNLDQAWLWVEKKAESDGCATAYGYRVDAMYGLHGHAAQSYGNPRSFEPVFGKNLGSWDASLDHGPYAWALPQAYGEVAKGDWSVKIGHFFTPVGYEVIPDTGNFFYSHTLTHYNSEPFTHTGVLAQYNASECTTYFAGWTLGWDTGFNQFDGGNNFVGGITEKFNDDVTFTYMTTAGNFGWRSGGEEGWSQHIVGVANLSQNTMWVVQSDYLHTNGIITDDDFENTDKGITNYLIYKLNDCWSAGGRFEWWKTNAITGEDASFYDITGGFNYHATANLVIRPEVRYDWTPSDEAVDNVIEDYNQTSFSIDAVLTF